MFSATGAELQIHFSCEHFQCVWAGGASPRERLGKPWLSPLCRFPAAVKFSAPRPNAASYQLATPPPGAPTCASLSIDQRVAAIEDGFESPSLDSLDRVESPSRKLFLFKSYVFVLSLTYLPPPPTLSDVAQKYSVSCFFLNSLLLCVHIQTFPLFSWSNLISFLETFPQ